MKKSFLLLSCVSLFAAACQNPAKAPESEENAVPSVNKNPNILGSFQGFAQQLTLESRQKYVHCQVRIENKAGNLQVTVGLSENEIEEDSYNAAKGTFGGSKPQWKKLETYDLGPLATAEMKVKTITETWFEFQDYIGAQHVTMSFKNRDLGVSLKDGQLGGIRLNRAGLLSELGVKSTWCTNPKIFPYYGP